MNRVMLFNCISIVLRPRIVAVILFTSIGAARAQSNERFKDYAMNYCRGEVQANVDFNINRLQRQIAQGGATAKAQEALNSYKAMTAESYMGNFGDLTSMANASEKQAQARIRELEGPGSGADSATERGTQIIYNLRVMTCIPKARIAQLQSAVEAGGPPALSTKRSLATPSQRTPAEELQSRGSTGASISTPQQAEGQGSTSRPGTGNSSIGDGRSSCIKLEPKGKGASVKNVCSERLAVSVCVANAKHWWPCGQSGGLINLRPEASYPVQDLSLWPGQVRWAACVPPATPQDWDGSEGGSFSCR